MKRLLRTGYFLITLLVLGGCGSISTNQLESTAGPAPLGLPERIVVMPFEVSDTYWGLEVSSMEEAAIKQGLGGWLSDAMAKQLKSLAPVSQSDKMEEGSGWLVQGRIRRVLLPDPSVTDSQRKPVLETTVFIFDLSRSRVQPFLTYDIQAKEVFPDPLAPEQEKGIPNKFLSLETEQSARLLEESLQGYIRSRGWTPGGRGK